MQSKTQFTPQEAEQIKKLLRQKWGADRATQKRLRTKLRDYRFVFAVILGKEPHALAPAPSRPQHAQILLRL